MTPETTDLIERMNEAAKKAAPGPWSTEVDLPYGEQPRVETVDKLIAVVGNAETDRQDEWEANAAFIALCSPDNILSLTTALATLRARLASCEAAVVMAHDFISSEYHDAKSVAMEGEWVSKDARAVFRALSEARAALTKGGEDA